MSTETLRGRFVWYDLMTSDEEAAIDFYSRVVGWGTQPFEGGEKPYMMWTAGEQPVGGVVTIDEDAMGTMPPSWIAYISTPDVDATCERIKELGGQVHSENMDIPDVGSFAVVSDPQGAAIAVYAPSGEMPSEDHDALPGEFSWHELATTDHEAAFDFYADVFGWVKTSDFDMGEMGLYQMFGQDGREYGGIFDKPDDMPGPPFWLYYVHVADLDKAVDGVNELGGQVVNGPMEVPGGDRVATCIDPQGAAFALHAK